MHKLVLADRATNWHRLKALVLDSVSSRITKRVYNLGLDEFFAWFGQEPRPGFTKHQAREGRQIQRCATRGTGSPSGRPRHSLTPRMSPTVHFSCGSLCTEAGNGICGCPTSELVWQFGSRPPFRLRSMLQFPLLALPRLAT
jgi:hypothetical protein